VTIPKLIGGRRVHAHRGSIDHDAELLRRRLDVGVPVQHIG
jgi:hypothetical protein